MRPAHTAEHLALIRAAHLDQLSATHLGRILPVRDMPADSRALDVLVACNTDLVACLPHVLDPIDRRRLDRFYLNRLYLRLGLSTPECIMALVIHRWFAKGLPVLVPGAGIGTLCFALQRLGFPTIGLEQHPVRIAQAAKLQRLLPVMPDAGPPPDFQQCQFPQDQPNRLPLLAMTDIVDEDNRRNEAAIIAGLSAAEAVLIDLHRFTYERSADEQADLARRIARHGWILHRIHDSVHLVWPRHRPLPVSIANDLSAAPVSPPG